MTVTETLQNRVHIHTVTRTVTDHVLQTEVVTSTRIVQETDHVTETDTTDAAEATSPSGDVAIADVNTDVVTVTDFETSTFLFTTTVDDVVATETGVSSIH